MKENITITSDSMLTSGIINVMGTGSSTILGNTGTSTVPNYTYINQFPNGYSPLQMDELMEAIQNTQVKESKPVNVVEKIDEILLDMAVMDSELELQAIKHLNYAKAYLEKRTLDVLNNKKNGNSKPD